MDEVGVLYSSFEKMNDRIDELIKLEYISQINEKQARLEALPIFFSSPCLIEFSTANCKANTGTWQRSILSDNSILI